MTLPLTIPGDPDTDMMTVSLQMPRWVYWQLVGTAEQHSEDKEHMLYVALRATITDFPAVEALALKRVVQRYVNEGLSDPKIGEIIGIPPRRIRDVRRFFGIERKPGRAKKTPVVADAALLVA